MDFASMSSIGIRASVRGGLMWLGNVGIQNSGTGSQAYQFTTNDTSTAGTMIVSQRNASSTATTLQVQQLGTGLALHITNQGSSAFTSSITAASAIARGVNIANTLVAAANNDVLVGLDINPTFTNGAFTGVTNFDLRTNGNARIGNQLQVFRNGQIGNIDLNLNNGQSGWQGGMYYRTESGGANQRLTLYAGSAAGSSDVLTIFQATRNVLIQNGGTTTDAGFRLDVNGTARVQGAFTQTGSSNSATFGNGLVFDNGVGPTRIFGGSGTINYQVNAASSIQHRFTNQGSAITSTGTLLQIDSQSTNSDAASNLFIVYNQIVSGALFSIKGNGNLLVGTSTDVASSILTMNSTTKGFLPPRMTTTQRTAISSPATGLVVYDTTLNKLSVYTGLAWETVTSV